MYLRMGLNMLGKQNHFIKFSHEIHTQVITDSLSQVYQEVEPLKKVYILQDVKSFSKA